jgi:PTH1 family peptidyl-tRNA hydrolase
MWLIVGLGNPGPRYAETRHNAGWQVAERLAERWGISLSQRRAGALFGDGRVAGERALVVEPQDYMNRSGPPTRALLDFYKSDTDRIVVVHDELDLPFGQLRLKRGGGNGGHNGLRSLDTHLPDREYARVRFGIGRPPEGGEGADYVLGRWSPEEREALPEVVDKAADAVELLLREGLTAAMNRFNVRPKRAKKASPEAAPRATPHLPPEPPSPTSGDC